MNKIQQPITIPPTELDSKGEIILESLKIKEINFGKNFHPEFKGYITEQREGVWISIIEAKEIGKGHFSKLIKEFKEKYNFIKIPTPSKMIMNIALHLGFILKEEWFGSPYDSYGTIMVWKKMKNE